MKKKLLFISVFISSMLFPGLIKAQTYHEDDKAGLRAILKQGVTATANFELAGLTVSDMEQWLQDENWVSKIKTPNGQNACVWNNDSPKRLVALSFENTTSLKMYGTIDGSYFAKLERLNISGNDFIELKGLPRNLKELFCYDNRITEIDLHECFFLEIFDCRNNRIESLNLRSFNLQYIDCSKNQLSNITSLLTGEEIRDLMFADVSENNLTFSSLRDWSLIASYAYAPQNPIQGGSIRANEEIVLKLPVIWGNPTLHNWYKENGTPVNVIDNGGGRFIPGDELAGEKLICRMTNDYYPQLTLEYHVNVTDPVYFIYDEGDKEGLRAFMRQTLPHSWPGNIHVFGLTPSDTLSWYESEEWIEKINATSGNCTWNEDTPKRLRALSINTTPWEHDPFCEGILDCTPFEKLDSLKCDNNFLTDIILTGNHELRSLNCALSYRLTTLDLSQNVNLEYLNCSNCSNLDTMDLSQNVNLEYLDCSSTEIQSLDVSHNIHLKYLRWKGAFWKNGKASTIDLTNNTELRLLDISYNQFTEIDLSQNINLQTLDLSYNNFKFSTLPLPTIPAYEYLWQKDIQGGNIPANWVIDLSSEYNINGSVTTYEWRNAAGGLLSIHDLGGGKFIAGVEHEGEGLFCVMTNDLFPELRLIYQVTISHALPQLLTDHLTLVESPQTDYYVASSGQTFKVKANTSVDPELVKIGLFKTTGSFVEEISFERENDIYNCRISNATASGSYMIQAYTDMGGNITILKRPENSHLVDILPFAFTKTNSGYSNYQTIASHLVLNTSEKNLYKAYIDETFRVVVNVPTTTYTRIGLFDLYGELVEDITQSVSGKIFTCMVSYNVFPDNYVIMPFDINAPTLIPLERNPGTAIMDRLPLAVDYNWGFRSAELIENRNDETGISMLEPVSVSLAQDVLYVNAQEEVKTIEIFDINGRLVKKVQSVTNVSIAELPAGIYIAKINTPSETVTTKIKKN